MGRSPEWEEGVLRASELLNLLATTDELSVPYGPSALSPQEFSPCVSTADDIPPWLPSLQ